MRFLNKKGQCIIKSSIFALDLVMESSLKMVSMQGNQVKDLSCSCSCNPFMGVGK